MFCFEEIMFSFVEKVVQVVLISISSGGPSSIKAFLPLLMQEFVAKSPTQSLLRRFSNNCELKTMGMGISLARAKELSYL